jgi:hypothetical protein
MHVATMRDPFVVRFFVALKCALRPCVLALGVWAGIYAPASAQEGATRDTLPVVYQTAVPAEGTDHAIADALGQIYTWTNTGQVRKYSADGRLLQVFSNNRLGRLTQVDVSNPMQVLLWFADFRAVVLLDRNMTDMGGPLFLIDAGYPEVRTIAAATDGNIWIYDEVNFRLRKIRPDGSLVVESQELQVLLQQRLQFTCLYDLGYQLIAADSSAGLLLFDNFGQYRTTFDWRGIPKFTAAEGLQGAIQIRWANPDNSISVAPLQVILQPRTYHLPNQDKPQWELTSNNILFKNADQWLVYGIVK